VDDVLVERVVRAEACLDGRELAMRVALVREEEEARVELIGDGVDTVRERVPAASRDGVRAGRPRRAPSRRRAVRRCA
jgi:hypothetical protein